LLQKIRYKNLYFPLVVDIQGFAIFTFIESENKFDFLLGS